MTWGAIILAALQLALSITTWLRDRQRISEGEAKAVQSYVQTWLEDMRKVDAARDAALRGGVPVDDPFNRDEDPPAGA